MIIIDTPRILTLPDPRGHITDTIEVSLHCLRTDLSGINYIGTVDVYSLAVSEESLDRLLRGLSREDQVVRWLNFHRPDCRERIFTPNLSGNLLPGLRRSDGIDVIHCYRSYCVFEEALEPARRSRRTCSSVAFFL